MKNVASEDETRKNEIGSVHGVHEHFGVSQARLPEPNFDAVSSSAVVFQRPDNPDPCPMPDNNNIYQPHPARIVRIIDENSQTRTFVLRFQDDRRNDSFTYQPGQFMMVSIPHHGEAPLSFSSTPTRPGAMELSVRRAGRLTGAMHQLAEGDIIGLRGPFGKPFPMEDLTGRNLLFVAGGIGLAPMRSVINFCLDRRSEYGRITILVGNRSPADICFADDLKRWQDTDGVGCHLTVDAAGQDWPHHVGLVTTLLDRFRDEPTASSALVCGPPIMIRFVIADLVRMGFADDQIITTMERHMKCGVGACGHCHMDNKLVCVDGPVFSRRQLFDLDIEELRG